MHRAVKSKDVKLPRVGTKLRACLLAIARRYPEETSTKQVRLGAQLEGKEVSSLLVLLMARGLIARVSAGQGATGGSLWELSQEAIELLQIKERQHGISIRVEQGT